MDISVCDKSNIFNNVRAQIDSRSSVTRRFRESLKHKDDGQTKFIKPNSQREDIIIKYWVSIGSIHREHTCLNLI